MKARAFKYERVWTIAQALAAYGAAEGDAVFIAGGQSLIPSLALRLQAPGVLVDIAHIDALRGVSVEGDALRIGALTRHAEMLENPLIARHAPLLALAAPFVAHPAIRNRGTIGGSVALADPAAEFPTVLLALRARFEIVGADGARMVEADDFFRDLFETALEPGELLAAVHVPCARETDRCAFDELARRRGDYGLVGCAARVGLDSAGRVTDAGIAFLSVGPKPTRAASAEQALIGGALDEAAIRRAQAALDSDINPPEDEQTPATMRRRLARVMLGRALQRLGGAA